MVRASFLHTSCSLILGSLKGPIPHLFFIIPIFNPSTHNLSPLHYDDRHEKHQDDWGAQLLPSNTDVLSAALFLCVKKFTALHSSLRNLDHLDLVHIRTYPLWRSPRSYLFTHLIPSFSAPHPHILHHPPCLYIEHSS